MHFTFDLRIDARREAVFRYLADPRNRPSWQASIRTFELPPGQEVGVGMHWRESVRGAGFFDMQISEYAPPRLWAESIRSRAFSGTVRMEFQEEDDATRLGLEADIQTRGLWRLVAPIGRLVLRREMRKDLGRVASLLRAR